MVRKAHGKTKLAQTAAHLRWPPLDRRSVTCARCSWVVAAGTLADLFGAGWGSALVNGTTPAFFCATCIKESDPKRRDVFTVAAGVTAVARTFRALPVAAPGAYPRIGGVGPEHAATSRGPAKEKA